MKISRYTISAGDYDHGGAASRSIKEQLKQIGVSPDDIRRAMIAAYEAEMNVIIHSHGGRMEARIEDGRIEVEVVDTGPGIADVNQAMKEGFSTAPAAARSLGFGAGLGLPNIRKNSDKFAIESAVGKGTAVRFTILLRPAGAEARAAAGPPAGAMHLAGIQCRQCLRCLWTCPMRARRVRGGKPAILAHLCIECGACLSACAGAGAAVRGTADALRPARDTTLVVPPAILAQFAPYAAPGDVLEILNELGFGRVMVTHGAEYALRSAVRDDAKTRKEPPAISPACPAVVRLIQTRFPSLLPHVAPFVSAVEAVASELAGQKAVVVASCPAQVAALSTAAPGIDVIVPSVLRATVAPLAAARGTAAVRKKRKAGAPGHSRRPHEDDGILRVTGIRHVIAVLDAVENGLMAETPAPELWACDEGCFGSPLLYEDAFIARSRWLEAGIAAEGGAAVARRSPLEPRAGVRLDEDMAKAVAKFGRISIMAGNLPGRDCGRCGCPTCMSLAEDVVLGRAELSACVFSPGG
ncbi:MAG: (Fe-S)-binding protein [Phycisphaerae bacterium]